MHVKSILILLTIGLFLPSCQKDLSTNQGSFESSLVVNSQFSPDGLWCISVSNTKDILDSKSVIENIDDATIILEDRSLNIDIPVVNEGNGQYKSKGFLPEEGHQYEIFVQKDGYKTARAFTYVPSNASVIISKKEEDNSFNEKLVYKLSIEIEDDPNQQNYYVWELVSGDDNAGLVYHGEELEELQNYLKENLPKNQPKSGISTALSSDGIFIGESYSEDFFIVPNEEVTDGTSSGSGTGGSGSTDKKLYLKVKSVSQDLYRYHESLKSHKNSANLNTSISTPLEIFSNIENGYGIFGSYNEILIPIDN